MNNLKIGFVGGGLINNLGTNSDMQLFFDCIQFYLVPKYPDLRWSLLTDRFYRRYLKLNELEQAATLMRYVEAEFKILDNNAIDINEIKSGKIKSDLDINQKSLFDIFCKYFESFNECIEYVKYYISKYGNEYRYEPVRVAITTIPYLMNYEQIPLSTFDKLNSNEKPIWWTGKIPNID